MERVHKIKCDFNRFYKENNSMSNIKSIIELQRTYFNSGKTLEVDNRINNLKKLKSAIVNNEELILKALKQDLGKSYAEGYMAEVGMVLDELTFAIKRLKSWAKPKKVRTSMANIPSKNILYREPYGVTLIVSPWNYPFQLTMAPLVGAIAGGNTAIIKPSRKSRYTTEAMTKLIEETFEPGFVKVVNAGAGSNEAMLKEKFDYIFFTGSVRVGKLVMEAASKHLTEVTLELGGKSPCIIDEDTNMDITAKRLTWGKFLNVGQTCVAPDYVLVHESRKAELIEGLKKYIKAFYGEDLKNSPDYGRIIDEGAFDRLVSYIDEDKVKIGGDFDRAQRYIAPTVMDNVDFNHRVMAEEIFGPILPIITYSDLDQVIEVINSRPKPLALYFFSNNRRNIDKIISRTSSGGVCINDTILHVASSNLTFGGVGESGMGQYHGVASFNTFTHEKSIVDKGFALDVPLRYPPFGNKLKIFKRIFK